MANRTGRDQKSNTLLWLLLIGGVVFVLAMGVLAWKAVGDHQEDKAQVRAAVEGLQSDITALGEQSLDEAGGRIEPLKPGPTADNEAARMHGVMRDFMNSVVEVRNTYVGELTALGWDRVMEADRLKQDAGLAESRRMISEARAAMARAEAGSVAAFNNFPAIVERAGVSAANKRDMLGGFDEMKTRGIAEMKENFAIEAQTIDEFEGIVDLLARVQWEVEASQILFHTDADVEAFNAHMARINALTEQLQTRQRASLERAQQSLSRIRP